MNIDAQIESFLFWKGEATSIKEIAKALNKPEAEIAEGLITLQNTLMGRGISLILTQDTAELRTAPAMSSVIEALVKEELNKDLGKAGLETLSIVLYEGPVSRRDIDYIRGVNSQSIVRNLLVRGLIDRIDSKDGRGFSYIATTELLAHLGITSTKDLPEFSRFTEELQKLKETISAQTEPTETPATNQTTESVSPEESKPLTPEHQ